MIIAIIVLGILLAISIGTNIGLIIINKMVRQEKERLWKAVHNTLEESRNFNIED